MKGFYAPSLSLLQALNSSAPALEGIRQATPIRANSWFGFRKDLFWKQSYSIRVKTRQKNMESQQTTGKLERKTIEKNRRILMKSLCSKLATLLPSYNPKVELSQQDQVCLATEFIKELKLRVEELKRKRDSAKGIGACEDMRGKNGKLPVVEVKELESTLEVVVIVGSDKKLKIGDIISILEDEGTEVVNCSFSCMAEKCIYSIYSKAKNSRIGFESQNVYQKLKELIH